jgi:hypothetical protein
MAQRLSPRSAFDFGKTTFFGGGLPQRGRELWRRKYSLATLMMALNAVYQEREAGISRDRNTTH